jgi:hypothetical protein
VAVGLILGWRLLVAKEADDPAAPPRDKKEQ